MSKLAVEIEGSIRSMVKRGRRGTLHVESNKRGDITSMEWKRSCFCLSRGLVPEMSLCPEHMKPIVRSHLRNTLEKLIDG